MALLPADAIATPGKNLPLGASSFSKLKPALFFPKEEQAVSYAIVKDFAYPVGHQLHSDIPPNLNINDDDDDDSHRDNSSASSSMFDDDYGYTGLNTTSQPNGDWRSYGNNANKIDRLPNYTFNSETSQSDVSQEQFHLNGGSTYGTAIPDDLVEDPDNPNQLAVALYDFDQENDNELPLREGQVINICYQHGQGWLVAQELQSGRTGLVPEDYVRLLVHVEGGAEALGLDENSYLPRDSARNSAEVEQPAAAGESAAGQPESVSVSGSKSTAPPVTDAIETSPQK